MLTEFGHPITFKFLRLVAFDCLIRHVVEYVEIPSSSFCQHTLSLSYRKMVSADFAGRKKLVLFDVDGPLTLAREVR